ILSRLRSSLFPYTTLFRSDKDMIESADYVIDIGPAAGRHGGEIVSEGTPKEIKKHDTLTADYLNGNKEIEIPKKRRKGNGKTLRSEEHTSELQSREKLVCR